MNDYIEHFGVRGMHWGVRKKNQSSDYKRAKSLGRKNPNALSNHELAELNTRMNLESNYRNLKSRNHGPVHTFVKTALMGAAAGIATAAASKYMNKGLKIAGKYTKKYGSVAVSAVKAKLGKVK